MKKIIAVILVLVGASLAIPQQAQRNASFDKLNVRNTATFTGTLAAKNINNTRYADQFAGATADVQIAACLAAVGTGTCDATGYAGTTQSISATVTVNARQTLLFSPSTFFQPGAAATNLFIFEPNSIIRGFSLDCTNFPAWSGIAFQNDTAQHYVQTDGHTEISNIRFNNSCVAATGTALKLTSSSSGFGIAFLNIHDWRVTLAGDGIFMTATTGGFVNGNHFVNMAFTGNTRGWHITGAGAAIRGNVCAPCTYEQLPSGTNAVLIDGGAAAGVTGNQWLGPIYDTVTPINITNTAAARNTFIGAFDGAYADNASGLNNFWNFDQSAASGFLSLNGTIRPSAGGNSDLGTTTFPYGNLLLGTANGQYTQFNPLASAGGKLVTIPDWSVGASIFQNYPFVSTLSSQYTNSTTGFTNVAGGNTIQFAVLANRNYTATCHLYYQAAATGGLNIEFTGPAAPTAVRYGLLLPVTTGTAPISSEADAYATSLGAVVGTAATNFDATVSFSLVNGANAGMVNLLAKSSAAVQLQIQSGSYCQMQ